MKKYDNYKDSEIEWIGEIPEHWEVKKVNYCFAQIGSGTTPIAGRSEYYENGEFNWLQTGDLTNGQIFETSKKITQQALNDYSTLKFYPVNSLVIAMYGATIGKTGLLKIESTTNQACCVLSKPKELNPQFAFYWLNFVKPHVISLSYGGGQPNINQEQIRNLKIQCPTFEEQTTIANYLDQKTAEIDQLIADKEELLQLYAEEKTAVINDLVTGKKVWDGNTWATPTEVRDSRVEWLGEIPEHWDSVSLKWVAKIYSGGTPSRKKNDYWKNGTIPWLKSGTVNQFFITKPSEYITNKGLNESSAKWIPKNSILIALAGQGKTKGTVAQTTFRCTCNQSMGVIVPNEKIVNRYLLYYLKTNYQNIRNLGGGDKRDGINLEMIGGINLPLMDREEQQSIVNYIEAESKRIDTKIENTQRLIALLKEYREALISEVVTGKVKVI